MPISFSTLSETPSPSITERWSRADRNDPVCLRDPAERMPKFLGLDPVEYSYDACSKDAAAVNSEKGHELHRCRPTGQRGDVIAGVGLRLDAGKAARFRRSGAFNGLVQPVDFAGGARDLSCARCPKGRVWPQN